MATIKDIVRLIRGEISFAADVEKPAVDALPPASPPSDPPEPPDPSDRRAAFAALLRAVQAWKAGRASEALDAFHDAQVAFCIADDRPAAARVEDVAALVISCLKDVGAVRAAHRRAAAALSRAGLKEEEARVLLRAADLELAERRHVEAYAHFNRAVSLLRQAGVVEAEIEALGRHAQAVADRGRRSEAARMLESACARAEAAGEPALLAAASAWFTRVLGESPPAPAAAAA